MQLLGRDHTTFYQTYETDSASILLDRPVVTLIAAVFPDPLNDYGKKGITPSRAPCFEFLYRRRPRFYNRLCFVNITDLGEAFLSRNTGWHLNFEITLLQDFFLVGKAFMHFEKHDYIM